MTIIFFAIGHACREQHSDRTFSSLLRQLFRVESIAANKVLFLVVFAWIDLFFLVCRLALHPPELLLDHRTTLGDLIYT